MLRGMTLCLFTDESFACIRPQAPCVWASYRHFAGPTARRYLQMSSSQFKLAPVVAAALLAVSGTAGASSHREAPGVTLTPTIDGTDFYMFRSYETKSLAGGADATKKFVTIIANYQPLQQPYGGPNYFAMNPNALYEIHIDNDGDGVENLTFQFRFNNVLRDQQLKIGSGANDPMVSIPLVQKGPVTALGSDNLNLVENYSVNVVRGDRRSGTASAVTNKDTSATSFIKPVDYIGTKTIPNYTAYANQGIYNINVPGCSVDGSRMFVGQRNEVFAVNLGTVFDLVNAPLAVITDRANADAGAGSPGNVANGNTAVTSLILEIPAECLKATPTGDPVIGAWTTASLRQFQAYNGAPPQGARQAAKNGGSWVQVSRLSHPLVNELVIGYKDKDLFNASKPVNDVGNFATYVTHPTLPALLEEAFPGTPIAPTNLPRTDLLNVFLAGIDGVNRPARTGGPVPAEMLRLNTEIPPVARAQQNVLGIAQTVIGFGGIAPTLAAFAASMTNPSAPVVDLAGFPNGRRPGDDVVDVSLVAVAGGLCLLNSKATFAAGATPIAAADNENALGLNTFTIPGATPTVLTSACNRANVPTAGLTAANLHDGVNQANVPLLPAFPYIPQPRAGAQGPTN